MEDCCRRMPDFLLFFSWSEFGLTITHIVALPLSFITHVCVDWCKTTTLVNAVALQRNNNSADRCSYSALDVYPTDQCVYAQYPVVWNTSTRGSLEKPLTINFSSFQICTQIKLQMKPCSLSWVMGTTPGSLPGVSCWAWMLGFVWRSCRSTQFRCVKLI